MKKGLLFAVGVVLSTGLLYFLVGRDLDAVRDELGHARYGYIFPCVALLLASMFMRAVRWRILLDGKVSLWHSFHVNSIGYFASGVLPLRLGDLARAWLVTRLEPPVAGFTALSTIVVERLLDVLGMMVMLGVMLALLDVPPEVASVGVIFGAAALAACGMLAVLVARPGWVSQVLDQITRRVPWLDRLDLQTRLHHFVRGIQPMRQPRIAAGAVIWTAIAWWCDILSAYVILFMMFDTPPLVAAVSMIMLAGLSVALPAIPGNLGPFEGAIVSGLWVGGLIESLSPPDNAPAVVIGVVLHALTLGVYVSLGLVGLSVEQVSLGQIVRESRAVSRAAEEAAPAAQV